jgi:hypothetical protein
MHEMRMQARCLFDCYRLERAIDHEIAKALAPIRQLRATGASDNGNSKTVFDGQFIRVKMPVRAHQQEQGVS